MKRLFCVFLSLALFAGLFSGCVSEPTGEVVAAGERTYSVPMDGTVIPDYSRYVGAEKEMRESQGDYSLSITERSELELFRAYAVLLQEEFGYVVTKSKDGPNRDGDPRCEYTMERIDPETGNKLRLYAYAYLDDLGNRYSGSVNLRFYSGQILADTGHRYQKEREEVLFPGASAGADLMKMEDGTYRTADGRLSTEVGKAFIRQGETVYTSDFTLTEDTLEQQLKIVGEQKGTFYFLVSSDPAYSDVCFTNRFVQSFSSSFEVVSYSINNVTQYDLASPAMLAPNGTYLSTVHSFDECVFEEVVFRKRYEDEDGTRVYYIYVKYKNDETPVEILCAAKPEGALWETEEITVKVSSQSTALPMDITGVVGDPSSNSREYRWATKGNDGQLEVLSGPGVRWETKFTFRPVKAGEVIVWCDYLQTVDQGSHEYSKISKRHIWKVTVEE